MEQYQGMVGQVGQLAEQSLVALTLGRDDGFHGFLPHRAGERRRLMEAMADDDVGHPGDGGDQSTADELFQHEPGGKAFTKAFLHLTRSGSGSMKPHTRRR